MALQVGITGALGYRGREHVECLGQEDRARNTDFFEFNCVVDTPRRAGPSIAERDNRRLAIGGDLIENLRRRARARALMDDVTGLVAFLGGTLAATAHTAKATTRAAVNTSPEPFSNLALSLAGDALVPALLLQPLVENAMKHGLAPDPNGGNSGWRRAAALRPV